MAKAKEIQYPTPEWIDSWLDRYEEKHPNDRLDYDALKEEAEAEWWDKQIDKGNPTPFDLTKEQQKDVKKMLGNAKAKKPANYSLEGKTPRPRKPNEDKRFIIERLREALNADFTNVNVVNIEKEITFNLNGNDYSVSLICHRKPKS